MKRAGVCATVVCSALLTMLAAPEARASLVYENIGGVDLIHDTGTNIYWTRNANLSGTTMNYTAAAQWAAALNYVALPTFSWTLPTEAEFTSLYTNLYPYGAPGSPGADHKYGPVVSFGAGANDSALDVQTFYWVNTGVDFNFYYGYVGGAAPGTDYSVWAVSTGTPEPATAGLVGVALVAAGVWRTRRRRLNC